MDLQNRNYRRVKTAFACAIISIILSTSRPAAADNYAYEGEGDGGFGVMDLTTGVFTSCGSGGQVLSGLGVGKDHKLYAGKFTTTQFYSVNLTNGALTPVAQSNVTFWLTGSTTKNVYAVGTDGNLYTINITTGQGTVVGQTGVPISFSSWYGLSTNSRSLYLTVDSSLYQINLKTGAATSIGTTGQSFGAEVVEGGTLFAGAKSPIANYSLNTQTGVATLVSNVAGATNPAWGLAPITASSIPAKKMCIAHKL